jgi:hypothetical protein
MKDDKKGRERSKSSRNDKLVASKETALEGNFERIQYMLMSRKQNAWQNYNINFFKVMHQLFNIQ